MSAVLSSNRLQPSLTDRYYRLGHVRFLLFYLLCGIAAVIANTLPQMS